MKAKHAGNQFEALFERACQRQGLGILRIADGCRRLTQKKLIPVKQPCDWILAWNNKMALIDTKTLGYGNFTASHVNHNQVDKMAVMSQFGVIGGFITWFRDKNKLSFFSVDQLHNLEPESSLKPEDGIDLGQIEDPQIKKIFEE